MSSKKEQSKSTTLTWGDTLLTTRELKRAKQLAFHERRSIHLFVKNGVTLHSNASAEEKDADEELVTVALESIQNMDVTQSNIAVLISALHRIGAEAKLEAIIDLEDSIL